MWASRRAALASTLCACALAHLTATAHPIADSTLGLDEVVWQSEPARVFVGSPTVVRLSDGRLLASHDNFTGGPKPECWKPHMAVPTSEIDVALNARPRLTQARLDPLTGRPMGPAVHSGPSDGAYLYVSATAAGTDWAPVGRTPATMYWANLWRAGSWVYLMGLDAPGGLVRLSRTWADGRDLTTWQYVNITSASDRGYGTGPTPTLYATDGRVYRAIEVQHDHACMFWANASSDLMNASSWRRCANPLPWNASWGHGLGGATIIEGNAVEAPDGAIYNVLRINAFPHVNKALLLRFDPATGLQSYDRVIDFPGGTTKFTIRRDPVSGHYITLSNNVTDPACPSQRSVLTVATSPDMFAWTAKAVVLADDTGMAPADVLRYVGFHYVDWQFDGPNIVYAVRTAYRGANSYHNSNRLTIKTLADYAQYFA